MRIGIIGFGNIGSFLARNLGEDLAWVVDTDRAAVRRFAKSRLKCGFYSGFPEDFDEAQLVVEAAGQEAVPLLLKCLPRCDVMVMSVGALADEGLLARLKEAAEAHGRKIYIPSGAIGGTDALCAVSASAKSVVLETSKSPASLGRSDRERRVVFEGNARDACAKFPKNVNVAATLSLAGIGFEKTKVRIVSDPRATKNTHRITVESPSGNMSFEFENIPSEENPKTSALACLSALKRIRKLGETVQIG